MKKRIICCQFGKKFNDWHVENLKYMIDHHSGIEYDDFEVITNDISSHETGRDMHVVAKK